MITQEEIFRHLAFGAIGEGGCVQLLSNSTGRCNNRLVSNLVLSYNRLAYSTMKSYPILTVFVLVGILLAGCCNQKPTPAPAPVSDGKSVQVHPKRPPADIVEPNHP